MFLVCKYQEYKRKQQESNKRKITERELSHLNHKIDKLLQKLEEHELEPANSPDEECVICINAKATMQTFPCGHRVVCRKCFVKTIQVAVSQRLLPLRCVICRTKILRLKQTTAGGINTGTILRMSPTMVSPQQQPRTTTRIGNVATNHINHNNVRKNSKTTITYSLSSISPVTELFQHQKDVWARHRSNQHVVIVDDNDTNRTSAKTKDKLVDVSPKVDNPISSTTTRTEQNHRRSNHNQNVDVTNKKNSNSKKESRNREHDEHSINVVGQMKTTRKTLILKGRYEIMKSEEPEHEPSATTKTKKLIVTSVHHHQLSREKIISTDNEHNTTTTKLISDRISPNGIGLSGHRPVHCIRHRRHGHHHHHHNHHPTRGHAMFLGAIDERDELEREQLLSESDENETKTSNLTTSSSSSPSSSKSLVTSALSFHSTNEVLIGSNENEVNDLGDKNGDETDDDEGNDIFFDSISKCSSVEFKDFSNNQRKMTTSTSSPVISLISVNFVGSMKQRFTLSISMLKRRTKSLFSITSRTS